MTMGDMMNTLIQPRHAKLGLAGHEENWPLAGYAIREIQQGFTAITKSIPRWRGLPVPALVEAAVGEPIKAVIAAIKQKDTQKFAEAYGAAHAGLQRLPRHRGPPVRGHQGARRVELPEPGFFRTAIKCIDDASGLIHLHADVLDDLAILFVIAVHQRVEFLERQERRLA